MNIDLVVLIASVVTSMLLAVIIFLRNPQGRSNRIFAFFSIMISCWAVTNFLADHGPSGLTLLFTRLTFVFGLGIGFGAVLLGGHFPTPNILRGKKLLKIFYVLGVATLVLSMTPWIVSSAAQTPHGTDIQISFLYPLFLVMTVFALSLFVYGLRLQYKAPTTIVQKSQIKLVLAGVVTYAVLAIVANLILPIFLNNWTSSRYGPIFALLTVALIGYAIVRHQLFDIRTYAVRSLGYLTVLFLTALLYAVPAVLLTTYVLNAPLDAGSLAILVLITLTVAFLFQPLKIFIDNTTKRLFYRDAYEPQELFNKFNQALVSTVELEKLLNGATNLIILNLKSAFCSVVLEQADSGRVRTIGAGTVSLNREELRHLQHLLKDVDDGPVVTDYLQQDQHALKAVLSKYQIAVLAPLFEHPGEELGYLTVGAKKSGSPYNAQDIKVIGTLANELSIAAQNALRFEEIQRFNETLQDKIEEATRKLRQTNDKLRKLDETKDDFISMASHQLRTPLTSVKGYVSMVLDGDAGKITALQRKLLMQSFISSQRMVYLISDLLNVSRLKTGKFIIEAVPTNLANVIEEEIDQLQETAKGRNLELIYKKPEHFPTLMLDETKIRQVLMNFIDNAVYYTPSGGHITINLVDKGRTIEYTVVDDGIGVSAHEQHHLFSKFFRAHNAKRARPDGTGLGLFMAKKVIIAQGGAIIFKSREGHGSTFGFTLAKERLLPQNTKPAALPPRPATPAPAAK
jgi:signal transduction histidine kinase